MSGCAATIAPEKASNALHALQGHLIHARSLAYPNGLREIAERLDTAECLPWLVASRHVETESFRDHVDETSRRHGCAHVLARFDDPRPGW